MIYIGEILKGKRNGKGKEYYNNGQIKFEGEFLNGNYWNGKIYDSNFNIIAEIENGKGLIEGYDSNKKIRFKDEYLNGKKMERKMIWFK